MNSNPSKAILFLAHQLLCKLSAKKKGSLAFPKKETTSFSEKEKKLLPQAKALLEEKGFIKKVKGRLVVHRHLPSKAEGVLHTHPRGFGFVSLKNNLWAEVFIPKQRTASGVDGDLVVISIDYETSIEKGPEGSVEAVLSRGRDTVVGCVIELLPGGEALAYSSLLKARILVKKGRRKAMQVGDRILISISNWGERGADPSGTLQDFLGSIYDPGEDVQTAIQEYCLREAFPDPVLKELETFSNRVTPKEMVGREDFRNQLTLTIDPKTAKDFDDALTFHKHRDGRVDLAVHIADVSHYVRPGTALDEEAFQRANSTYFPGTCVPMLPPSLSENLCSLRPRVIRLTTSVCMSFDSEGEMVRSRVVKGVIRSAKRYTYEQAQAIIDHEKKDPHSCTIRQMAEFALALRKRRIAEGVVEINTQEMRIDVDDQGVPRGTSIVEHNLSHQLVEEFMILANKVVAEKLHTEQLPALFRIHEDPDEENIKEFVKTVRALGYDTAKRVDSHFLNQLFAQTQEDPLGPFLVASYIRSMKLAIYNPESLGHYGLNLEHYCHFTSPIRRYADLIVHRALFGEKVEAEKLEEFAEHCSKQERVSSKAEQSVLLLKKLRWLLSYFQEDPSRLYPGVVSKVLPFGVVVAFEEFGLEAMLHLSAFSDDYYHYDEQTLRLVGAHTGRVITVGVTLELLLLEVNLLTLESRWTLPQSLESVNDRPKRKRKGRKKKSKDYKPEQEEGKKKGRRNGRKRARKGKKRAE